MLLSTTVARPSLRRWRAAVVAFGVTALLMTSLAGTASAHGSTSDPPSRTYNCRFNTDRFDPDLATTNPMCAQAWEAEPQALYDWMALLTTEGDTPYEEFIPDGRICSAGLDKYAAFDVPGEWEATEVDNTFTLTFEANAPHETEFYRIYVTKQGFDPTSDELTWDDLELVHETGQLPAAPEDSFQVSAPGRTGRHIVYLQWRRLPSHSPESFYACSDVIFPGADAEPAPDEPDDDGTEPATDDPSGDTDEPTDEPTDGATGDAGEPTDEPTDGATGDAGEPTEEPGGDTAAPAPETPDHDQLASILEWLLALLSNILSRLSVI